MDFDDLKNQKTKGRVQTSKNSYSRIFIITSKNITSNKFES
jgi:hypothetical protein